MPARDVSVEAVYVTIPEYSTIEKVEENVPQNFTGKTSEGDKVFTLSVADPHDQHMEKLGQRVSFPMKERRIRFPLCCGTTHRMR